MYFPSLSLCLPFCQSCRYITHRLKCQETWATPFYPFIRTDSEIKEVCVLACRFNELLFNLIEFVVVSLFRCSETVSFGCHTIHIEFFKSSEITDEKIWHSLAWIHYNIHLNFLIEIFSHLPLPPGFGVLREWMYASSRMRLATIKKVRRV